MSRMITSQAEAMKKHLETYPASVGDIKCLQHEVPKYVQVFTEVLGAELMKRVTVIAIKEDV